MSIFIVGSEDSAAVAAVVVREGEDMALPDWSNRRLVIDHTHFGSGT
jgi:hypothetical protein